MSFVSSMIDLTPTYSQDTALTLRMMSVCPPELFLDYAWSVHSDVLGSDHYSVGEGCREQPPRGAPWESGLVGHFVQTWPDSECSHTVQFLDCSDLN